jgi:hypothetical protein
VAVMAIMVLISGVINSFRVVLRSAAMADSVWG